MQNHQQSITSNGFEFPQLNVQFPEHEQLKCPRCDSSNTKFCYYNNYNLSQPRHFCKNCRRYWTKGGTLRNIPVGGGCRKNSKRPAAVAAAASKQQQQQRQQQSEVQNSSASTVPSAGLNFAITQNPSLKFEPGPTLAGIGVGTGSSVVEPAESFVSLLGFDSEGQFSNFIYESGKNTGQELVSEGFVISGVQNGWPNDLAIKNPGSK